MTPAAHPHDTAAWPDPWPAPALSPDAALDATVAVPGSKSLTNRYLLLAAVADRPSRIRGALESRDSALMRQALTQLGAGFRSEGGDLVVEPLPLQAGTTAPGSEAPASTTRFPDAPVEIDTGLAGTVMRFLPPLIAALGRSAALDGDPGARVRPMGPVIDAVRGLGAVVEDEGRGALPFTMRPGTAGVPEEIVVDASGSSQFLSALLLAAPLLGVSRHAHGAATPKDSGDAAPPAALRIRHQGPPIPSLPHVEMTVEVLAEYGIDVAHPEPSVWVVPFGRPRGHDVVVEPDLSNAGPFLAAAAVSGGTVRIPDWPRRTTQGGDLWREILPRFGATVRLQDDGALSVTGNPGGRGGLPGVDLDLAAAGELAPTVAAICAVSPNASRLRGIGHLRGHETDRLAALVAEIHRLGGTAKETPDGLKVLSPVHRAAEVHTYADHRMATFAAVIGLVLPGVLVQDVATTAKTLPDFPLLWQGMLAGTTREGTR